MSKVLALNNKVLISNNKALSCPSSTVEKKDVNFVDYDGTVLYSYSAADFASLGSLPSNPVHEGLTAQGWNWTLSDAKSYVSSYGFLNIGQMYITNDGKTRVYVNLTNPSFLSPIVGLGLNGTAVIDWGDGSSTETITGTSTSNNVFTNTHTYSSIGQYVITINITSGTAKIRGTSGVNAGTYLFRYSSASVYKNYMYTQCVEKIEIGSNISFSSYALYNCVKLKTISLPVTCTFDSYVFYTCAMLQGLVLPTSFTSYPSGLLRECYCLSNLSLPKIDLASTSIGTQFTLSCYSLEELCLYSSNNTVTLNGTEFQSCRSLRKLPNYNFKFASTSSSTSSNTACFSSAYLLPKITFNNDITVIPNSTCSSCYSLTSVTIPNTVTAIGSSAFYTCYNLTSITLSSELTTINQAAFQYCSSLTSLTIPSKVTSIAGQNVFHSLYALTELHFKPTTPPTVENSNTFSNLPTTCKIYVPTGYLSAYTSATNYPSSATYTYVEESS